MEGLTHYEKEERPWGEFERFTLNEQGTVKIITVRNGEAFSLQTHAHRSEFWRILSGNALVTVGTLPAKLASPGDQFFIPEHTEHRLEASGGDAQFLEIAFGQFNEADITRLSDKYGRS